MDPVKNPYAPGAGQRPPELAGRDRELQQFEVTLEQRNLDHSLAFETWFLDAGDTKGAAIVRTIHRDEIRHVAFGLDWLRRLKNPGESDFDAWESHLHWPLRPEKAVGEAFDLSSRRAAGLDDAFLERLKAALSEPRPSGSG